MSDTGLGGQSTGIAFVLPFSCSREYKKKKKKKATEIQNRVKAERVLKTQTFCLGHPLHKMSL